MIERMSSENLLPASGSSPGVRLSLNVKRDGNNHMLKSIGIWAEIKNEESVDITNLPRKGSIGKRNERELRI